LPLAHVGGLSVVTRALRSGTPLVVHDAFDAAAVERAADEGCTRTSLVPTALARIDPSRWRTILVGGQAAPPERPANVVATYGMTETGSGIAYDGRPLDGVEIRTTPDGEVQVRGPMLLRAYRDGTDPRTSDGWLPTGDIGTFEDGMLSVAGRRGDLIITGGENVWPIAVERALSDHPAVAEVAVVGRSDPEWGQLVVAVVVPRDPAMPPALDELRTHAKERLPAYAAPRALELRRELPRTALGKVRRRELDGR
jgi:O-succinylbenzoic acid--CoA ligase